MSSGELLVAGLVLAALLSAPAWFMAIVGTLRGRHDEAVEVAGRLGLAFRSHGVTRFELHGRRRDRAVRVLQKRGALHIVVSDVGAPARLDFHAKRAFAPVERTRSTIAPDIEVGDAAFDESWTLDGPEEGVVRALFRLPALRERLTDWRRVSLSDGTLEVEVVSEMFPAIPAQLERALDFAELLESLADIEPADLARRTTLLLEARGVAGSSGAPVPVRALAPSDG